MFCLSSSIVSYFVPIALALAKCCHLIGPIASCAFPFRVFVFISVDTRIILEMSQTEMRIL